MNDGGVCAALLAWLLGDRYPPGRGRHSRGWKAYREASEECPGTSRMESAGEGRKKRRQGDGENR